ncbi:unnamed protein product [Prunus brigantina]
MGNHSLTCLIGIGAATRNRNRNRNPKRLQPHPHYLGTPPILSESIASLPPFP